ncbi:MAG: molybdate ABC transporter substrate-binding protein [Thermosynechococcaceae cyanobacterium]
MNKRRVLYFLGLMAVTALPLIACNRWEPMPPAKASDIVLISAATSLQDALKTIEPLFERAYPNVQVTYNFGASGTLQQQIEQGAPTDVFISAAQKQMNALQKKDLILNDTRRNLLTNQLVLIVPKTSTLNLTSFQQLANANVKKIAIGEPRSVPAGQYAEELGRNLGILDPLEPKFVFSNTARNLIATVASGNVDAGIVFATDAKLSDQVKSVTTASANLHSPILYPAAVLKRSQQTQVAKTYLQFLESDSAKAVFKKFGFGTR